MVIPLGGCFFNVAFNDDEGVYYFERRAASCDILPHTLEVPLRHYDVDSRIPQTQHDDEETRVG